jgi:hypothetical protein
MRIAKKNKDELESIKNSIEAYYKFFAGNFKNYHEDRKFLYQSNLTIEDISVANALDKPVIEFNMVEGFVSRMIGEFAKQQPSIEVREKSGKKVQPQLISLVEGHFRQILEQANKDQFEINVYDQLMSGGFSGIKVYTKYENEKSMTQEICMSAVSDPTLIGFDVMARKPHKGDGNCAFELSPYSEDEFTDYFGSDPLSRVNCRGTFKDFNWSYNNYDENIILVGAYYKKKMKEQRIVKLANNRTMTTDEYEMFLERWKKAGMIAQPPAVVGKPRKSLMTTICRYVVIESEILDYKETDYSYLPIIFVGGNSKLLRDSPTSPLRQVTRSYIHNAKGQQKLINLAGCSLANELENAVQSKWKIAEEGINPEAMDAYTNNQIPSVALYRAYDDDGRPLPEPQEIMRTPAPPEIAGTFAGGMQVLQTILGSYDAQQGINKNDLSGIAIIEGATQSNAAAMPYIIGFLQGLTQAANVAVDLMPKYLVDMRALPIMLPNGNPSSVPINQNGGIQMDFQAEDLDVSVTAGVNFAIQKSRALNQIIALCNASQLFAQFINQMGLEILLDNLEIRGIDQLKDMAQGFMQQLAKQQKMQDQLQQQQMQQAGQQNNPIMAKIQIEQQRLQQNAQQNAQENQLKTQEIQNDKDANDNERLKIMMQAKQAGTDDMVQIDKANVEKMSKVADLELQQRDQTHRHTRELLELAHNVNKEVIPREPRAIR